jgi:putative ABC transport system permease protein
MIRNYLKIAIRNLMRNSVYSFINITGLAVGIACSILIILWVYDELSVDRFLPNHEQLHQVWLNATYDNGTRSGQAMPLPLGDLLSNADSRIKNVAVSNWGEGVLLTVGENKFNKVGKSVSDPFLEMFQFEMLQGDRATALDEPMSIVLTESTAKALFGDDEPLNKLVRVNNQDNLVVTGIIADLPKTSTFRFDYLMPFAYYESTQSWVKASRDYWDNFAFQYYVELQPGAAYTDVEESIRNLLDGHTTVTTSPKLFLHPLGKWWLYSKFENGKIAGGNIEYVKLFAIIAAFILIIACINFMNLATARSEHRAREVGIRKSVGSGRRDLVVQFIGESLLITLVSFLIGLVLVELALPFYNELVGKELRIDYSNPAFFGIAFLLILITGFLAGSYPAFYLSSFKPVKVLKGKIQVGKSASTPRKVLVTLQFGFSILLIIGTIVIYQQIQHLKSREVGYDRENLMMVWTTTETENHYNALKQELLQSSAVVSVCKSNSPITSIFANNIIDDWPGKQPDQRIEFATIATDYDYTKTMGIKLIAGRDFSPEYKSDSLAIILNQAAVDVMGLTDPIGATVKIWDTPVQVIGVIENVLMERPHEPIKPLFIIYDPGWSSTINVRLARNTDLKDAISQVETLFRKYNPAYPFEYRFADWEFEKKFIGFNRIGTLANLFSVLTLLITGLGLFGLAAFTAEQRTKEIGIRKVLGASVSSVVLLLSKDFSRLILVAFLIAAPLSWWAMSTYLQRYPYRIDINWWIFPATGLFALLVALLIVSSQAIKASTTNPVDSLRSE